MIGTFEALVDSSIVIDLLRDYPFARTWAMKGYLVAISRMTWFEIIQGADGKKAQKTALEMIRRFTLIEIEPEDITLAAESA